MENLQSWLQKPDIFDFVWHFRMRNFNWNRTCWLILFLMQLLRLLQRTAWFPVWSTARSEGRETVGAGQEDWAAARATACWAAPPSSAGRDSGAPRCPSVQVSQCQSVRDINLRTCLVFRFRFRWPLFIGKNWKLKRCSSHIMYV